MGSQFYLHTHLHSSQRSIKKVAVHLDRFDPEKMAEVLDLVIKVATEKGVPPPNLVMVHPHLLHNLVNPKMVVAFLQPGIGEGGAPQPGGHGGGSSGGGANPPNVNLREILFHILLIH